jgi:hypothetical protein
MRATVALHNPTYDLLGIEREGLNMERNRTVMLKPDDPVWAELIADIEAVVSTRYAEDLDFVSGLAYAPSAEEPGFEFAVLNRKDQQNLLADMVDWRQYGSQGMSHEQQRIVIANVLDEKPQEQWLEGVFAESVLENKKVASFKAMVRDMEVSPGNHVFEEMNGDRLPWDDLSAAAKLLYIARDAVISDVPFEQFAQVVKDTIGDVGEAALRVLLDGQKELHAIAELFPDDGRTEPTPLVELVKEMMDYASDLEMQEWERRQGREKPLEGIEGAKAPEDILREERPLPGEVKLQQQRGLETDKEAGVREYWEANPDKLEAIHQLWNEGRESDFVSFLRAAGGRPEMAGVPLGHVRAAYDKAMEGEWERFRSCMSEFPASWLQHAVERMREHDAIMQDPFNLILYKHPETVLAEQKAVAAQDGVAFSGRHEDVLRGALELAGADRSAPKTEQGRLSLRDLRNGSHEQEGRGEGQKSKSREMER